MVAPVQWPRHHHHHQLPLTAGEIFIWLCSYQVSRLSLYSSYVSILITPTLVMSTISEMRTWPDWRAFQPSVSHGKPSPHQVSTQCKLDSKWRQGTFEHVVREGGKPNGKYCPMLRLWVWWPLTAVLLIPKPTLSLPLGHMVRTPPSPPPTSPTNIHRLSHKMYSSIINAIVTNK